MNFIQPYFYNDIVFDLEVVRPETVNTETVDNVVTKVFFLLKGTYSEVVYEHENELEFSINDIDLDSITNFDDLTESQVKSWIEENKPMDALKHSIAVQIKESIDAMNQPSFVFKNENLGE